MPADDAAVRYKNRGQFREHDDHTRGTVGIDAYAEAAVGHGATCMGAASGPSSARSAAISLRISATMARTASSSCDVRSVLRAALGPSDMVLDVGPGGVCSVRRAMRNGLRGGGVAACLEAFGSVTARDGHCRGSLAPQWHKARRSVAS